MGALSVPCGERVFDLWDHSYSDAEVRKEVDSHWDDTVALGSDRGAYYANVYEFAIRQGEEIIAQRYSVASGGPSVVGDRSAVCIGSRVIYAQGNQVACLASETGHLLWHVEADLATCFELYLLSQPSAIIVHGELDITKLWPDGAVAWTASGRDIFTGPFEVREDIVFATDWNEDHYSISIADGHVTTDFDV